MHSISNFLLKSVRNNLNGLKLVFIYWLFYKKKIQANHSGHVSLKQLPKINIFKLIGLSGLIKTRKKNKDKKVLAVLIHHKCKDSLVWEAWVEWMVWVVWVVWADSLEWVVMIMMKMINKEILMILKSKKKLNKNLQHDCIKSP